MVKQGFTYVYVLTTAIFQYFTHILTKAHNFKFKYFYRTLDYAIVMLECIKLTGESTGICLYNSL